MSDGSVSPIVRSSFYVAVRTSEFPSPADYPSLAGQLVNMYCAVFTDPEAIAMLTKQAQFTSFKTEVEVSMEDDGLTAAAVIDMEGPTRIGLDKTKLSRLLKAKSPFEKVKVEKRAAPPTESEVGVLV